jgi:HEAT repeat protein
VKKRDRTEEALDALSELRRKRNSGDVPRELRSFLANRSNLVVAKAARIASELRADELIPDLTAAFDRLISDPAKLDKGCVAMTATVEALYSLDYDSADVYLKGARHVQMEKSFGPPVDAAARLRGHCALGLVRTNHPDALFEVVRLLADKEPHARIGAARALSLAGETGELLLLLKTLTGEPEIDVLAECFAGMLASGAERSVEFVASYLEHDDPAVAETAALALGACGLPAAIAALSEKWRLTARPAMRKTLLLALATARQETALEFLISLVAGADEPIAIEVIAALRAYRNDERTRARLAEAVAERGDATVAEAFREQFG